MAKDLLIFFKSESAKNLLSPITANKGTANSRITCMDETALNLL